MKMLLYEYCELEEKVSRKLKLWKAWHITLYVLIAVFGILNFTFLLKTKELVDDNCVFYPVILEFHMVDFNATDGPKIKLNIQNKTNAPSTEVDSTAGKATKTQDKKENKVTFVDKEVFKREISSNETDDYYDSKEGENDLIIANATHHLMLQTDRTLFGDGTDCEFAEYMPVLSTIFAVVWISMFTMCPGGGKARSRAGLQQPWRILAPALFFALLMVAFTGFSFATTNGGLHAFCASFHNYTNSTTCSSVNPFLERSAGESWGFGERAALTRAASAGVWAGWACAAALLLARCLAAPDFALKRTGVYLTSDPQQKITPSLKKNSSRSSKNSTPRTFTPRPRNVSERSEPTLSTLLVTSSPKDSAPTSLITTPVRDNTDNCEMVELAQTPARVSST